MSNGIVPKEAEDKLQADLHDFFNSLAKNMAEELEKLATLNGGHLPKPMSYKKMTKTLRNELRKERTPHYARKIHREPTQIKNVYYDEKQ